MGYVSCGLQVSDFWDPVAWPDLLRAYQPVTRLTAILHILMAIFLAALSWKAHGISSYLVAAVEMGDDLSIHRVHDLDNLHAPGHSMLSGCCTLPVLVAGSASEHVRIIQPEGLLAAERYPRRASGYRHSQEAP